MWLRGALSRDDGTLAFLRTFVKPGSIVYDVGANIGQVTRFISQDLPAKHVYAFEPMPENIVDFARNMRLATAAANERVTLVPCALAAESGVTKFQVDDLMSQSGALSSVTGGLAAFGRRRFGLPPLHADVVTLTLEDAIDVLRLPEPDVLKIDVEGAEALVLGGGRRLLSTGDRALYVEVHGPEPQREVLTLLTEMGYSLAGSAATWTVPEPIDAGHESPLEYVVATRARSQLDRMASACARRTT
jgi:FkbM family methyltransferase